MLLGVTLGLIAGYVGGKLDAFIMRIADVQLSFPAILIALLIDGVARAVLPREAHGGPLALFVLIFAIGISNWVQYARTVRGSTMVEKNKEYVQAARVIGIRPLGIMLRHLLPNVLGPVLVLATINIATAIITEATLSFLGVGVPPTQPSLGTLIRDRQRFPVFRRMVDHDLSGRRAGDHGAGDQPARRLAARRAQSRSCSERSSPTAESIGDLSAVRNGGAVTVSVSASAPLLAVEHLRVEFPTRRGTLVAVDDVSFDDRAGRSARRRRRIGRRQIADRRRDHRPDRSARAHRRRRDPPRRDAASTTWRPRRCAASAAARSARSSRTR